MHEERMLTSLESVDRERQVNRIRASQAIIVFISLQLAILGLFAIYGAFLPWIIGAFMVLSIGTMLIFLVLYKLMREQNNNLHTRLGTALEELSTLSAKLDSTARHDRLTGVFNRQALIEILDSELLRAHRTGHPFCFAIIDLDHFSALNETYGSASGDLVLKAVAETSLHLLRALDRLGRIGGEEFGIILPATWLDQGAIAMGRLTKAVGAYDWGKIAPGLNVTFSAGITTNAVNDTAETVIRRADDALLQAKREGRNRIVQAEEALPDMPPLDLD
jgi:diguanylate cyclase (GGDEF)-like protein